MKWEALTITLTQATMLSWPAFALVEETPAANEPLMATG